MSDSGEIVSCADSPLNKIYLSSSIENFKIDVGPKVIEACSILKNVLKYSNDAEPIVEVEMTKKQLEKFIELHEHFNEDDPMDKKERNWVKKFFSKMSDDEFKQLCWKADFLDSQRFLNNAAFYLLIKLQIMKREDFQKYLNIVNDYNEDERTAIKAEPLKYFTSIVVEQENVELDNPGEHQFRNNEHVKIRFYPLQKHKNKKEFIFQKQNFAFPKSLINFTFIASKIPTDLFIKLYSTCKYFFVNLKLLPSPILQVGTWETNNFRISYKNETIDLPLNCVKNLNANFCISDQLSVSSMCSHENWIILSKKIIRSEIGYACVFNSKLTLTVNEFKNIFTSVNEAVLCIKVIDSNKNPVPVEDLLKLLPNVQHLKYQHVSLESYTSRTVQKIAELKRNVKLKSFVLHFPPPHILNAEAFAKLIKNHANLNRDHAPTFQLIFDDNVQEEIISNFYSILISLINSWETKFTKSTKPKILLCGYGRVLFNSQPLPHYPI